MAQTIKLKRSATAGNTPTTSQLALGELGINTTDGKLFLKKSVSGTESIVDVGGLPLTGGTLTGNLSLGDNVKAQFGASNNLQIYSDGTHSRIYESGSGLLIVRASNFNVNTADGSESYITMQDGGAVTLYNNGLPKIATNSSGIDVTGSVVADGLTVDGGSSSPTHLFTGARAGTLVSIDNESTSTSYGLLTNTASVSANSYPLWVTSNDANRLTVGGNGDISFYDGSGNQGLFWDSSTSRLGLGTTVPAEILHLNSTSGSARIRMTSSDSTDCMIVFGNQTDNATGAIRFDHSDNSLTFNGYNNSERLRINADGSSVFSDSVTADKFKLSSTNFIDSPTTSIIRYSVGSGDHVFFSGSTSNSELLRINGSNANVNIPNGSLMVGATTAPETPVHVKTTAINTAKIKIESTATNSYPTLILKNDVQEYQLTAHGGLSDDFTIYDGTAGVHRLRINTSGNATFSGSVSISGTSSLSTEFKIGNLTWNQSSSSTSGLLHQYRGSDGYSELQINNTSTSGAVALNIRNASTSVARINNDGSSVFSGSVTSTGLTVNATGSSYPTISHSNGNRIQLQPSYNYYNAYSHIFSSLNGTTNHLTIANTGNVNIPNGGLMVGSTTAPSSRFHLKSASRGSVALRVTDSDTTNDILRSGSQADGDGFLQLRTVAGAGNVLFDASGVSYVNGGNFGIGTISPNAGSSGTQHSVLTVKGSGSLGNGILELIQKGTTGNNQTLGDIKFFDNTNHNVSIEALRATSTDSGTLGFKTRAASGSLTERMRIDASGNVGIGESIPTEKLHVGGNIKMQASTAIVTYQNAVNTWNVGLDAADASFKFKDGTDERLRIDNQGRVGIGNAVASSMNAGANQLVVGSGSTGQGITLYSSTSTAGSIHFADGTSGDAAYRGQLVYNHNGDYMAILTAATEAARIDASQNLLVGTTSLQLYASSSATGGVITSGGAFIGAANGPAGLFNRVNSEGDAAQFFQAGNYVGSISVSSSALFFNSSSDERLKENIVDSPVSSDDIDAIQVRSFDWKASGEHQKYGMIAQELQAVAPEAVSGDADSEDMMGVDYSKLVPMLIKEIQSLRQRVAQLEE